MPWYDHDGLKFHHADGWVIERDTDEDGHWQVSIQSPETAFVLIKPLGPIEDLEEAAEVTLETLREDYPDLEEEEVEELIGGARAPGYDATFTSLDIVTTCQIRFVRAGEDAVLVMSQHADVDSEECQDEMERLRRSISFSV